jgi:hypothetical protein
MSEVPDLVRNFNTESYSLNRLFCTHDSYIFTTINIFLLKIYLKRDFRKLTKYIISNNILFMKFFFIKWLLSYLIAEFLSTQT